MSTFNEFCTELVAHLEGFNQSPERETFLRTLDFLENVPDTMLQHAEFSSPEMVAALAEFAGYVQEYVPKEQWFAASARILQRAGVFNIMSVLESEYVPRKQCIERAYEAFPGQMVICPIERQMEYFDRLPMFYGLHYGYFSEFREKMADPFCALIEYVRRGADEETRAQDYAKLIGKLALMVPSRKLPGVISPLLDDILGFEQEKSRTLALQKFDEIFHCGLSQELQWEACSRYFDIVETVKDEKLQAELIENFISSVLPSTDLDKEGLVKSASRAFSLIVQIKDPIDRREFLLGLGDAVPSFGEEQIEKLFLSPAEDVDPRRIKDLLLTVPNPVPNRPRVFLNVLKMTKKIDDLERRASRLTNLALVTMQIEKDATSFLSVMTEILENENKEQRDTALEALTRDAPLDGRTHSGLRMLVSKARDPEQLLMMLAKNLPKDGEHEEEHARTHLMILSYGRIHSPEQRKAFKELLVSPKEGLEGASLRKSGDGMKHPRTL